MLEDDGAAAADDRFRASRDTRRFTRRVADMARAAEVAYYNGDEEHRTLKVRSPGGVTLDHEHRWDLSGKKVQVYEYVAGTDYSIIVAFRGTDPTSRDDLEKDFHGLTQESINPTNPWNEDTAVPGSVGRGFHERAAEYMGNDGDNLGLALRDHIDHIMNLPEARLDIHVTGHSLGGIASQLFSLYAARYMASRSHDPARYRIFDFAFNPPKGVDEVFATEIAENVAGGRLVSFSFTVELDPVSEWNFTIPWLAAIDVPPNDLGQVFRGYAIGYCPHGQLPRRTLDPKASLDNHLLDEKAIMMWEEVFGASYCHRDAAACMKDGYDPLVLEYTD